MPHPSQGIRTEKIYDFVHNTDYIWQEPNPGSRKQEDRSHLLWRLIRQPNCRMEEEARFVISRMGIHDSHFVKHVLLPNARTVPPILRFFPAQEMIPVGEYTISPGLEEKARFGQRKPARFSLLRLLARETPALVVCLLLWGCKWMPSNKPPGIEFTQVPPADEGGPSKMADIAGHATGDRPGQHIVLYAKAGVWWVQPFGDRALTAIESDHSWKSPTHLGTEYAALLVDDGYDPPKKLTSLPPPGGRVVAVSTVKGSPGAEPVHKTLQFSGYQWKVREIASDRNGASSDYDPANAWTDASGYLHLHITRKANAWTCSEVSLPRSLGYGTYSFSVRDVSHFEPAAALSLLTWDDQGAEQNHREMDIEISQWGDPRNKNAGYVIQPYYVPENAVRFIAPPGPLTYSLQWQPGRASFQTSRDAAKANESRQVASKVFSAGIPSPGGETVHITFCDLVHAKVPLQKESEVVVERFQYLP